MTALKLERMEGEPADFADELSDEALDRADRRFTPGCQNLCPVFPSAPDR